MEQNNKQNKKIMLTIVGIAILVIGLVGVTYAFFNYTRTGSANVIKTGRIYFNSEQGTAINLTNMFPIDVSNGIPNDNTKVGTVTLNVTGDTTYDEGIEYLVSAVNVQNTIGSGANAKSLPISIDVSVASNTTNDPATTLGTSDEDYFDNRGGNSSIYKVLAKDTISNNGELLVGYITKGATGIDGNIVIKAYLDKAKVAITDTYDGNETDNMGTTTEWVNDRVTFTTQEWNSLQANGVSFQIRVESNEGIWVEGPPRPICKRATMLHTETCNAGMPVGYLSARLCYGSGYYENGSKGTSTITYGNIGVNGSDVAVGDAFDCDINDDGIYNSENERFYYISNYFDTTTETFDNDTAVLIYYSSVSNGGVPSFDGTAYDSSGENWHGPATAVSALPNNKANNGTWRNDLLKTTNRKILSCTDIACTNMSSSVTSMGGHNIVYDSSMYDEKAARLLTLKEFYSGCNSNNCEFVLERTGYANQLDNYIDLSPWLETTNLLNDYSSWGIVSPGNKISYDNVISTSRGVKPVIDVPYSKMEY